MGKRRAAKQRPAPAKREREKYDCVVCQGRDCIEFPQFAKYKTTRVGLLVCRVCGLQWHASLCHLEDKCDLYAAWIDALEEAKGA